MDELAFLNLLFRKFVPVIATGLDRTFNLVGRIQRGSKPAKSDFVGAGGVPATRLPEIQEPPTTLSAGTQHVEIEGARPAGTMSPTASTSSSPGSSSDSARAAAGIPDAPQVEDGERQEDGLAWAGSLAHAAAASAHIGNVIAMIRAGWLVPETEQLATIMAALDAMEAFHARTDNAIAPVLAAMDETQLVDLFDDFDTDLPIELPELDPA